MREATATASDSIVMGHGIMLGIGGIRNYIHSSGTARYEEVPKATTSYGQLDYDEIDTKLADAATVEAQIAVFCCVR